MKRQTPFLVVKPWSRILPLLAILIALAASSQAADTGSFGELIDIDGLMFQHDGVAYQVSSYDRSGGNNDGDIKKNMQPRKEGDGYVVFDEKGPGCIYRIWSASARGWIRFYFDGETEPRISLDNFGELFSGKYVPFVKPVSTAFLGGAVSYVPIPFAKSCKIVMELPQQMAYLQITWRTFTNSEGVRTFTRELPPEEQKKLDAVVAAWSKPGDPPAPFGPKCETVTKTISSGPGSVVLADLANAGIVRAVKLKLESPDPLFMRKVVLKMTTDGQDTPDVWSPVGDFFATGFGGIETRSLLVGVKDGEMYSYFPMPFEKGMKIELINESGSPVTGSAEVICEPVKSLPKGTLKFHAWWRRQDPVIIGQPFPILEATGQGHWCGLSLYMYDLGGLGFLEGDEQLEIDGLDKSHYHGTGTEDYFNCGWYFGTSGCQPLYGCTIRAEAPSFVHAYRVHMADLVPFTKDANIVMEHGPENDRSGDYSAVTYWYASPGTTNDFTTAPAFDRLPTPVKVLKAIEAEGCLDGADGKAERIDEVKIPVRLSGAEAMRLTCSGTNGSLTFRLNVLDDSGYDILGWFLASPTGVKAEALVDGKPSGIVFDTRSDQPEIQEVRIARLDRLQPGEHTLMFVVRGATNEGGNTLTADCFKLVHKNVFEGEDMKVLDKTPPRLLPQKLRFEGQHWSDDMQVWFLPGGPKEYFTLELPIEKAGKYRMGVYMTKAGDYGIVQFELDGKVIGEPFDGYGKGIARTPKIDLGEMELAAGSHSFKVEVTGKNPESHGHIVGLDCITLEPVE